MHVYIHWYRISKNWLCHNDNFHYPDFSEQKGPAETTIRWLHALRNFRVQKWLSHSFSVPKSISSRTVQGAFVPMETRTASVRTKKSDYTVPEAPERAEGSVCHPDAAERVWRKVALGKLLHMCVYTCIRTQTAVKCFGNPQNTKSMEEKCPST